MQQLTPSTLHRDAFVRSFERIAVEGAHLSTELQKLFKQLSPSATEATLMRHRLFQAVRYNDVQGAWAGTLDAVRDLGLAFRPPFLAPYLTNTDWLQDAPTFVRVNTLRTSVNVCLDALAPYLPTHVGDVCLRIDAPFELFKSTAFREGWFEQQDISSQRVGTSLHPIIEKIGSGLVVDMCAGAGGKTLHIAARMQNRGRILALDIDEAKLEVLRKRARRAGAHTIETRTITSSKVLKRLTGKADLVVVDAPCSGSGVLRRNPDILYHLDESSLRTLVDTQSQLLRRAVSMCKVNGHVAFVTCSIIPDETHRHLETLARDTSLEVVEQWQSSIGENGGDGFFFCLLRVGSS